MFWQRASLWLTICVVSQAQTGGIITTVAGNGNQPFSGDGVDAKATALYTPVAMVFDAAGNLFIADQFNNRVRKVDTTGVITTIAGTGMPFYMGDGGLAVAAPISSPTGLAIDTAGNLYIGDVGNQRIRKVSAGSGVINTVAGNTMKGYTGDGGPATQTSLYNAGRIVVDPSGNILIADQSNHRVRKVNSAGIISTVAGNGMAIFAGDGGAATAASLNNPTAIALDVAGNLYISDQFNQRIRKVDATGTITTFAGNGTQGFSGDGGPAVMASLGFPGGIVVDPFGNIVFSDDTNYRVRSISPTGIISTIAGNGKADFSGDGGPAVNASLNGQFGVTYDAAGNLYIADSLNNRIRKVSATANPAAPAITSAGVVNAASNLSGLSPGSLATIYGRRLSGAQGIVSAPGLPWPAQLSGTSVLIGGIPAPIYVVANINGQEQINLQVPFELAGQTAANVVVNSGGISSQPVSVPVFAAQPGLFLVDGANAAVLHGADSSLVGPTNPAVRGETVVIFATGLGSVLLPPATGSPASGVTLSRTTVTPSVTIGAIGAPVAFSGLAPGFIGLYQVNVVVPAGAVSGSNDLVITVNSNSGKAAKIAIQ